MLSISKELISNNKAFDLYLRSYFNKEKLYFSEKMYALFGGSFFAFYIVDLLSTKDSFIEIAIIRFMAVSIIFSIYFIIRTKPKIFLKYYEQFITFTFFISGSLIIGMIYFSRVDEIAYNTYFCGVVLVITATFPLTYINVKTLLFLSLLLVIEYVIVFYLIKAHDPKDHISLTLNNVFFMFGGILVGLLADNLKKTLIFRSFHMEQKLKSIFLQQEIKYNKDSVKSNVFNMVKDAKLCQLNTAVKFISLNDIKDKSETTYIVDMILNVNKYSFEIGNNNLLYCYQYDPINMESIKRINEDLDLRLHNIVYENYSNLDINLSDIDKLFVKINKHAKVDNVINLQ